MYMERVGLLPNHSLNQLHTHEELEFSGFALEEAPLIIAHGPSDKEKDRAAGGAYSGGGVGGNKSHAKDLEVGICNVSAYSLAGDCVKTYQLPHNLVKSMCQIR